MTGISLPYRIFKFVVFFLRAKMRKNCTLKIKYRIRKNLPPGEAGRDRHAGDESLPRVKTYPGDPKDKSHPVHGA